MAFWKKRGRSGADWRKAYPAQPTFYARPDGTFFGAFTLMEGVETILPKAPRAEHRDGQAISGWKLVFFSISRDTVLGDAEYFSALQRIRAFALEETENAVLVKGLSNAELEQLKG